MSGPVVVKDTLSDAAVCKVAEDSQEFSLGRCYSLFAFKPRMKSEVSGSDKFISYVVNLFWLSHNFLRLTYLMHQILLQPRQRIKMTMGCHNIITWRNLVYRIL